AEFSFTATVKTTATSSVLYPSELFVFDKFGNSVRFGPQDLSRLGSGVLLDIVANLSAATDSLGPTLAWLRVEGGPERLVQMQRRIQRGAAMYPITCTVDGSPLP